VTVRASRHATGPAPRTEAGAGCLGQARLDAIGVMGLPARRPAAAGRLPSAGCGRTCRRRGGFVSTSSLRRRRWPLSRHRLSTELKRNPPRCPQARHGRSLHRTLGCSVGITGDHAGRGAALPGPWLGSGTHREHVFPEHREVLCERFTSQALRVRSLGTYLFSRSVVLPTWAELSAVGPPPAVDSSNRLGFPVRPVCLGHGASREAGPEISKSRSTPTTVTFTCNVATMLLRPMAAPRRLRAGRPE
jgi:hypothetical protein